MIFMATVWAKTITAHVKKAHEKALKPVDEWEILCYS